MKFFFPITLALTLVLSGCGINRGAQPDPPLARQITASNQCGFVEPGLVYMDSRQRLEQVTGTRGINLIAMDDLDFSEEHLLLVAAGRKTTGGHGVALQDSSMRKDVLELTVEVRSPSPDQMVTQALTSPCAVVAVTAEGWTEVKVSGPGFDELSVSR